MQKTLIVLVALVGFISASSMFRAPITEMLASSKGNVSIEFTNSYQVPVDYKSQDTAASSNWVVSLYSSQQVFIATTGTCLNFKPNYPCAAQYDYCVPGTTPVAVTSPYFSATATSVATKAFVDYTSWAEDTGAPAVLVTACDNEGGKVGQDQFNNANGIWGLGYDGAAKANFIGSTTNFWVSFANNTVNIKFNQNNNTAPALYNKIWSVKADGNWNVNVEKGIKILDFTSTATQKLIFDINFKTNGFPKALYDGILTAINKLSGVKCDTAATESPKCTGTIKQSTLGNLTIQVSDTVVINLTAVDIVAGANFLQEEWKDATLNLRSLDNSLSGNSHVIAAAASYIIIGSNTLNRFITVFDISDQSVTAYYSTLGEAIVKGIMAFLKWIIIAIVGSIIVCCLCICFCCGGTAWIVAKLGKKDKQDNYYQSSQTDPFVARK